MSTAARSFAAALETLGANPLRTVLSTLGVIIGVASLVAILALGDGLERYNRDQLSRTTDVQSIVVRPRTYTVRDGVRVQLENVPAIERADAAALQAELGDRAAVALLRTRSGWAALPGDTARRAVLVTAITSAAASLLPEGLVAGRFIAAGDVAAGAAVAVVPAELGEWLGAEAADLAGRELDVDGARYRVVGVEGRTGGQPVRILVPFGSPAARSGEGPGPPAELAIRASRVEDVEALADGTRSWLASRFGDADAFVIANYQERAAQARQALLIFKLVMGAIAGISLLVGGIGIMNILLASVIERTREIGIRKAAGARHRDILLQFLAESVAITGIGCVLGAILGLVAAFSITAAIRAWTEAPIYAAFTWGSIAVAAAAAVTVGLVFGTYPARRAARLSPIEAIRHE